MSSRLSGDGILLVDKPAGPTSHDMVSLARRVLGTRKVGHTGTLDPFASGLLILCVNRATRLAEYLQGHAKAYEATIRLGQVTTTLDTEGEVVEERPLTALSSEEVLAAVGGMVGAHEQRPPVFSAKKVKGERAYERARRGEIVELSPVPVQVHEARVLECELPFLRVAFRVSTGTYIRALARDLGEGLSVGGHLVELRRTGIGPFSVERALDPVALEAGAELGPAWIPALEALDHLPRLDVDPVLARRLVSGQSIPVQENETGDVAVALDGVLLAVAQRQGEVLKPRKVFPHG